MGGWQTTGLRGALLVAALLLLARSASIPLLDPDESRFARTSVEMLRSGDTVVPQFEDRPRLAKPPMLHWMQSALFWLVGPRAWAARLPAALATLGSLLLLAWIARRRFGEEGAFWAVACLITMPLVFVAGRIGTMDALLSVHVLAAIAPDVADSPQPGSARAPAFGALLGLAFLVKGPVGVVLALLILLAGRTVTGADLIPSFRATIGGVAAFCAVVLPWGLAFVGRLGWDEVLSTINGEALQRFTERSAHVEPFWYYPAMLPLLVLPWGAPLAAGLGRVLMRGRDPASRTARYAAAGLVAGLAFLSLSKGKLPTYVVPLMPLAALVVTWEIGQELERPGRRGWGSGLLAGTLPGMAVAFAYAALHGGRYSTMGWIGFAVYCAASVVALAAWTRARPRWVYGSAAGAGAAVLLAAALWLHPQLARERSLAPLVDEVAALRSTRPIVVVGMKLPGLTFYIDRIPEDAALEELAARLEAPDDPLFVVSRPEPGLWNAVRPRLREVGHLGKYRVYEKLDGEPPRTGAAGNVAE